MTDLTDKELSLSIELRQTRIALANMQLRACANEEQLAKLMGGEAANELREFFVEQERREKAASTPPPAAQPAAPQPSE